MLVQKCHQSRKQAYNSKTQTFVTKFIQLHPMMLSGQVAMHLYGELRENRHIWSSIEAHAMKISLICACAAKVDIGWMETVCTNCLLSAFEVHAVKISLTMHVCIALQKLTIQLYRNQLYCQHFYFMFWLIVQLYWYSKGFKSHGIGLMLTHCCAIFLCHLDFDSWHKYPKSKTQIFLSNFYLSDAWSNLIWHLKMVSIALRQKGSSANKKPVALSGRQIQPVITSMQWQPTSVRNCCQRLIVQQLVKETVDVIAPLTDLWPLTA